MTTTNSLDVLAGSLSESQRRRMVNKRPLWTVDMIYIEATLIAKGLLDYRRRYWLFGEKVVFPTPLGLALRSHLEKQ